MADARRRYVLALDQGTSGSTALVVDPDGIGPFFEVPIAGPLPETLNFIP